MLVVNIKYFKKCILVLFLCLSTSAIGQSTITIEVSWGSWSSENRVTLYDPDVNQIGTSICNPADCFTGASNTTYNNLGSPATLTGIPDGAGYSLFLQDTFGDGWNGTSYVRVYDDGVLILDTDLNGGNSSTVYFSIGADYNTRPYEEREARNVTGNFIMRGNTNVECVSGCPVTPVTNNGVTMGYIDVDSDTGTDNSSSSTITIPPGATVAWAGLYWGGAYKSRFGGITNPTGLAIDQVKLKQPGAASYTTVNASVRNVEATRFGGWNSFMAHADVTGIVQAAGSGEYVVANIALVTGSGFTGPFGGWTMVIVYEDPTEKSRNIAVWDGFQFFGFGDNDSFTINGLLTPSSGSFDTATGYFAFDGEADLTGDFLSINGTALSNALNPADNTLNGTISEYGIDVGGRNPVETYNWGIDIDVFDVTGLVPNSATDMDVVLGSSSEGVWGGVFVTSNEIAFPAVSSKTFSPSTIYEDGESMVTLTVNNPSNGVSLTNFVLTDNLPAGMTLAPVPNANSICGGTITAVPGSNSFVVTGANIPAGATCSFTFSVVVNADGSYTNTLSASDVSNDQNIPLSGDTSGILTVLPFIDSDLDGIGDHVDLDDDNDGIEDYIECGFEAYPTAGPISTATFSITGSAGGPVTLNNITFDGETYAEFIYPDSYDSNFETLSIGSNDATSLQHGTELLEYTTSPDWNAEILPLFQSPDMNWIQNLVNTFGGTSTYWELGYNTPIFVNGENFVVVTERNLNNSFRIEAFDLNGNALAGQLTINTADYINTGVVIDRLGGGTEGLGIALIPLSAIAPMGSNVAKIRLYDNHGSNDAGDGKLFVFGKDANSFIACTTDTDGDGDYDYRDADSDGDGCNDVIEAGFTDPDDDGIYGTGIPTVDAYGLVVGASYGTPNTHFQNAGVNACTDTDNDGTPDIADLDDDNDGILDTDEGCFFESFDYSITGGNTASFSLNNNSNGFVFDITRIDNSFNLSVNGTQLTSAEINFYSVLRNVEFVDGTYYGDGGINQVWQITWTTPANPETPLIRIIVDANGKLKMFGSKTLNGPLEPMVFTNGLTLNTVSWSPTNNFILGQAVSGSTFMQGSISSLVQECSVNTDGDGLTDELDLDSDGDGCLDTLEAGFTDPDNDGILGTSPVSVDADGLVIGQGGYSTPADADGNAVYDFQEVGTGPTANTQPTDQTVLVGNQATFTSAWNDVGTFQWQESTNGGTTFTDIVDDGVRYVGAGTANLAVMNVSLSDNGYQYRLFASNPAYVCASPVPTNTAILYVRTSSVITNRRITYRVKKN